MAYDDYDKLRVTLEGRVLRATIDNPPINLFDLPLLLDVDRLSREVSVDPDVSVAVLDSANPDFFIAHADVGLILGLPRDPSPPPTDLGFFHAMVDRFRTMPVATIAVIEGRIGGGGSELALSMDMRFAALDQAVLCQPEVAIGILPGGSGTQRLPRLVGRGRALEVILGCGAIDALTAERWGWVNRALPAAELRPFVDGLAARIASFPPGAVARAKAAVATADPDPVPGLLEEGRLFSECLADPEAIARMERFLEAGGQTVEVERDLPAIYSKLS